MGLHPESAAGRGEGGQSVLGLEQGPLPSLSGLTAEGPELMGSGGRPLALEPIKDPEVVWPQEQSGDHRAALDGLTALIGARQPSRAPGAEREAL